MSRETRQRGLDRREFLARSAKAGLALAGAGTLTWGLSTARVITPPQGLPPLQGLPSYGVKGQEGRLAIVKGAQRGATLAKALELLGGIRQFVSPGDVVLIKVNAAFATPALVGATTHPDALLALARLCKEAGAKEVRVSDNPIQDPAACFQLSGLAAAAARAGARLVLPRAASFCRFTLPGGRLLSRWPVLFEPMTGVNKVIGLAPVKDHHRSGASLSIKNWYGLLGGRRNLFHQEIHAIITELAAMVRPTLVVLDGTISMMRNGPTGGSLSDLQETRTMIVSTDQVAADSFALTLLGKSPEDAVFVGRASAQGLGSLDWEGLRPRWGKAD